MLASVLLRPHSCWLRYAQVNKVICIAALSGSVLGDLLEHNFLILITTFFGLYECAQTKVAETENPINNFGIGASSIFFWDSWWKNNYKYIRKPPSV